MISVYLQVLVVAWVTAESLITKKYGDSHLFMFLIKQHGTGTDSPQLRHFITSSN